MSLDRTDLWDLRPMDSLAGDRLELRITGRLDSLTAPQLLEVFEKQNAAGGIRRVRVDCHALDYIICPIQDYV